MVIPMIQDAVIRKFEIMGEAVKRLSENIKKEDPGVPWRSIAGFRDVLIHQYMGVDINQVWNIVENDLPKIKNSVERMLKIWYMY